MDSAAPVLWTQDRWKVWHVPGFDPGPLVERAAASGMAVQGQFESTCGFQGYWKGGPLRFKTAVRYQAKQRLLGLQHPRRSEFENLNWLRARMFCAPRALAAAEFRQHGLVRHQWLYTESMPNRRTWSEAWPELLPPGRERCIVHLADEVARMHSLHFVHRDLFPRNLMVDPSKGAEQPVGFLDAWAGGPGMGLRGPAYDIACLALDWPDSWTDPEQALFLNRYLDRRNAHGKPVKRIPAWIRSVETQRETWVHKLTASSRRRGGRPIPKSNWRAPIRG
ncbi:MAG: lipopolysaccharide kinase InaA family protein [Planctomycetota bacterium]|nr:lipopolysaccharide kinase InaA family protein [Planctomycetota bacterium]